MHLFWGSTNGIRTKIWFSTKPSSTALANIASRPQSTATKLAKEGIDLSPLAEAIASIPFLDLLTKEVDEEQIHMS